MVLVAVVCSAQTYEIDGKQNAAPANQTQAGTPNPNTSSTASPDLGWGSSIDVARQAHAAQDALKRNDYAAAASFAERAAKSAPQNADLWFLLGYTTRLAERYPASVEAYTRGLQIHPNSVAGMAGLAQTYARMGRQAEAEQLLRRVVEANPKDANSLQLAGELLLNTDPEHSVEFLRRADALQPAAHTDILMARAYDRLAQPQEAAHYLNLAKSRAPKDPEVLRAVAGQYRDEGHYDQAIASLEAIPSKTTDVEAELAYTFQVAGRPQEAAELYGRLAKSAKGNIGLDLSAAQAWINVGRIDAAREFADDAARVDGNNYRLHAVRAQIDEAEDEDADAASEYGAALSNLPQHVPEGALYPIELRLDLYELQVRQQNAAAAKEELERAAAAINSASVAESARPEMLRLRAAIEMGLGNLDAANKDLQEALALAPTNVNSLLNYASLQWKLGQKEAAGESFRKVLELDPHNRTALSSLGYLARDKGDTSLAETYFKRAVSAHPKDFGPHLALGDLYTAERRFRPADTEYENAFQRMPSNPLIIAGATNAALESHNPELAKHWLERAKGAMNENPQIGRERERYLMLKGDYSESAKIGSAVLDKLPHDRDVVVYLDYDLYYLGRYDDALTLATRYDAILPNDKDLALIAGYVHAHEHKTREALSDFTRALERDPKMATGYVNRGFVLNDLKEPAKAVGDFESAIRLQPDYGEAHLGLAFADLQLHRPKPALAQLGVAQKLLGRSRAYHLARAEAYRQERDFLHAESEYRTALQENPNDFTVQLEYADTLYRLRRFPQAISALDNAEKLDRTSAFVYALKAQVYAGEGSSAAATRNVGLAEQYGGSDVDILMATGGALLTLGERGEAMQRFTRALDIPGGDRIAVRLAIAQVFLRQGRFDDVRRQLALGFAEARVDNSEVTPDDILEAANIFLAMHEFDLAETYFEKARLAGADPRMIEIGLANAYLAEGKTAQAQDALASLGPASQFRDDYDYTVAAANVYRQRQDTLHALTSFAQASTIAGNDNLDVVQRSESELATEEGRPLTQNVSVAPEASFAPALEDINVYTLDAKILNVTNPALLPPPRHSFQSLAESHYRIHLGSFPTISGTVGESFTTGRLLFPSVGVVQDRNTYDTFFNGGITPILHFGTNQIAFNGGLQFTVRRDTISPVYMSQDLFRQYLYVSTNSFFNWVSVNASAIREAGPFTDQNLHSRDASASVEFTVGRPWGNTALLTGYAVRDLLFNPLPQEYFNTSTYVGLQHKFGSRLTAAILAEDLRSWRVQGLQYATAQALLPGGRFDFRVNPRWDVQGSFVLSRGSGFHEYDNAQSQFLVSYNRSVRGNLKDDTGTMRVAYPLRISFGVQQQTFYNFAGSSQTTVLPVIHFNLF